MNEESFMWVDTFNNVNNIYYVSHASTRCKCLLYYVEYVNYEAKYEAHLYSL